MASEEPLASTKTSSSDSPAPPASTSRRPLASTGSFVVSSGASQQRVCDDCYANAMSLRSVARSKSFKEDVHGGGSVPAAAAVASSADPAVASLEEGGKVDESAAAGVATA